MNMTIVEQEQTQDKYSRTKINYCQAYIKTIVEQFKTIE